MCILLWQDLQPNQVSTTVRTECSINLLVPTTAGHAKPKMTRQDIDSYRQTVAVTAVGLLPAAKRKAEDNNRCSVPIQFGKTLFDMREQGLPNLTLNG